MKVEALLFVLTKIQPAIEEVITIANKEKTVIIVELINALWNWVLGEVQTTDKLFKNDSIEPVIPNGSFVTKNEDALVEFKIIRTKGKKKIKNKLMVKTSSAINWIFLRFTLLTCLTKFAFTVLMIQFLVSCYTELGR